MPLLASFEKNSDWFPSSQIDFWLSFWLSRVLKKLWRNIFTVAFFCKAVRQRDMVLCTSFLLIARRILVQHCLCSSIRTSYINLFIKTWVKNIFSWMVNKNPYRRLVQYGNKWHSHTCSRKENPLKICFSL